MALCTERLTLDLMGYQWTCSIFDFVTILGCLFAIAAVCQLRPSFCLVAGVWLTAWLAWNAVLACYYLQVGALASAQDLLDWTTGHATYWRRLLLHCDSYAFSLHGGAVAVAPGNASCLTNYRSAELLHCAAGAALAAVGACLQACVAWQLRRELAELFAAGGSAYIRVSKRLPTAGHDMAAALGDATVASVYAAASGGAASQRGSFGGADSLPWVEMQQQQQQQLLLIVSSSISDHPKRIIRRLLESAANETQEKKSSTTKFIASRTAQLSHREDSKVQQLPSRTITQQMRDHLLLYREDKDAQQFLHTHWKSGEMLQLVKKAAPKAKPLKHFYPNLTFSGYSFTTFDGKQLNTIDFVAELLNYNRNSSNTITNVIHFYSFSKPATTYQISFRAYLALMGGLWLSQADKIIIWCNKTPGGRYWQMFVHNVTQSSQQHRVIFGNRTMPHSVFGVELNPSYIQHSVDVMKLEAAVLIGGFFLDNDAVAVRSLEPLRKYSCVMGEEASGALTIGVFASKPASKFLILWYMQYQNYYKEQWGHMSIWLPGHLQKRFPTLCRVESTTLARPSYVGNELNMLAAEKKSLVYLWNWGRNYVVHLWSAATNGQEIETVLKKKSMFGEVARHVLQGQKCKDMDLR